MDAGLSSSNSMPNPKEIGDAFKDVGEGIDSGSKALVRMFSGIPRRSQVAAELKSTEDLMDEIDRIRSHGKKNWLN